MDDDIRIVLPGVKSMCAMLCKDSEAFDATARLIVAGEDEGTVVGVVAEPDLVADKEPVWVMGSV